MQKRGGSKGEEETKEGAKEGNKEGTEEGCETSKQERRAKGLWRGETRERREGRGGRERGDEVRERKDET